jgi:hypothetical protein
MSGRPSLWMIFDGVAILALGVGIFVRATLGGPVEGRREMGSDPSRADGNVNVSLPSSPAAVDHAAPSSPTTATNGHVVRKLGWGSHAGQIGLPAADEAHGETPFRLAAGADGLALLDNENQRVVRLGHDGQPRSDVRMPIKHARDVAVAKDGSLLLLDADGAQSVMLVTPAGAPRGKLPIPNGLAEKSRSLFVAGDDVYVESYKGVLTRVGDVSGNADPNPAEAPGQPTREGRGFVTARIANPESGKVHVYVVERGSLAQRFSREIGSRLFVEGIFLVDTNAAGTIYIGVTGGAPGSTRDAASAQLICLEPEHGEVLGAVDLPVRVGPEAILDAKALDAGGVVYSVFTKEGIVVERQDCP